MAHTRCRIARRRFQGMAVSSLLSLAGCAASQQARTVDTSGFLGDYSQLRSGVGSEALLTYLDPSADFSRYHKLILDPVSIWANSEGDLRAMPTADQQALADLAYTRLRALLAQDYEIVDKPGPGTLRLRTAITEAQGSNVVADIASTAVPQVHALASLGQLAAGTTIFTGQASGEVEVLDSLTNRRLLAGVDRRFGTKQLVDSWDEWSDVQEALRFWGERIRARLAELRALRTGSR